MSKRDYDAIVVGSGPNGLAAAITLQKEGLSVLLIEAKSTVGGGMRTSDLTLPGFKHDVCSAVHPMAVASPFFKTLPLDQFGLRYLNPEVLAGHPFDGGNSAVLYTSLEKTANSLGLDEQVYKDHVQPLVENWPYIAKDILAPLRFPQHPLKMAKFGINALTSSLYLAKNFKTEEAKGLWGGMAAHSIQPLSNVATSAIAMVLLAVGHVNGWPIPEGGSQQIANALSSYFLSLGGKIETNIEVTSLSQLPSAQVVLFDLTPKQLLKIAGHKFSAFYTKQLERYRYGMGVFKIDWALSEPAPFTSVECRKAGTVHLGNTLEEIAFSEKLTSEGGISTRPFVLFTQPSIIDPTRAPEGKHTAWAYCHVPNGSTVDMTAAIESQVERFAPGFKDIILARATMNTQQVEAYNANYIGGDINGGVIDIGQLFTRPVLRMSPYTTPSKDIYICSSSTPPGGGVHGMCGYHAAKKALKQSFEIKID